LYASPVAYLLGFIILSFVLVSLGVSITHTKKSKQLAGAGALVIAAAIVLVFYGKIH
jgi:hypothetical protein